jgi:hypothetical protein
MATIAANTPRTTPVTLSHFQRQSWQRPREG